MNEKKSPLQRIREYMPDKTVLDEHPAFDEDFSQPLFHKGSEVGCITLHGIGGTPANIRVVADALIARGYTVLSPTLPGHGETVRALNHSTYKQWLQCVYDAYDRLKAEGCTKIYALGLSLGGVLSGVLAENRALDGLVLICAPLQVQKFLRISRRLSWLVPYVRYPSDSNSASSWRRNPYAQMYDGFSTMKLVDLRRLSGHLNKNLSRITCPVLTFSAEYDDKVDPVSIAILEKGAVNAKEIRHIHLTNSPHGCTYGPEREAVAQACGDFIAELAEND